MKITRAVEYAVRCVLYLSKAEPGRVMGRNLIAKEMDIPHEFLAKIARELARAGLLEIIQGPKGGYRLLLPPGRISLLTVVEAVCGEISLNDCVLRPHSCRRSDVCSVHPVWVKARRALREELARSSFEDLVEKETASLLEERNRTRLRKTECAKDPSQESDPGTPVAQRCTSGPSKNNEDRGA